MARVEMMIDSLRQDLLHYEWAVILKETLANSRIAEDILITD